jgi:hypothetical protein
MLLHTGAITMVAIISLPRFFAVRPFDLGLKRCERVVPELIEPFAQGTKAVRIDEVNPARTFRPIRHKTRLLQHLQMLRYRMAPTGFGPDLSLSKTRRRVGSASAPNAFP